MKIKLKETNSGRWQAPSGTSYRFASHRWTDVNIPKDQAFFLKAGNGKYFEADEKVDMDKLEALIESTKKEEESVRGRNRIVKEPEPIKKEVPKKEEVEKPEPETDKRFKELKDLNKAEQLDMIKKLSPEAEIPRLEKDRIELIMKLEGE